MVLTMMTNALSVEVLLIAARGVALLVALCVLAWALMRWRKTAQRDAQRLFEQTDLLTVELNALALIVRSTSERLEELHNRFDTQSRLGAGAPAASQRGYEFATRLAKNGASAGDLITSCGISRHEAELLIRLNGGAVARSTAQENGTVPPNQTVEPSNARVEKPAKKPVAVPAPTKNAPAPTKPDPMPRPTRFAAVG